MGRRAPVGCSLAPAGAIGPRRSHVAVSRDRVCLEAAWRAASRPLEYRDARQYERRSMIELTLYTRNDCELCREMEEVIAAELPNFDARINRIEIDGNPGLEARFGLEVPVLFVNDRKAFKYRCTPRELRKRLAREARG